VQVPSWPQLPPPQVPSRPENEPHDTQQKSPSVLRVQSLEHVDCDDPLHDPPEHVGVVHVHV
jgi:hypothetical protein